MDVKFKDIDLTEWFKWLWDWLSNPPGWATLEGSLGRLLFSVLVVYLLIRVTTHIIGQLANLGDNWKKLGWPVAMSDTDRAKLRRRRQFASVLQSDLAALAKAENWNDQFFTDLEAEVEAEGYYYATRFERTIRRRSSGLRRTPSLIQAIESSAEQFLFLVGEPGSGKSIALRHLAHQFAERATKSSDLNTCIPLYVNLRELPPAPGGVPTADFIREFVIDNVRRGDADTADYVRENWLEYRDRGIWFLLFDSFDEIPAVLHAPCGSDAIAQYADAIRKFLAGMSNCRGIVASREFKGPESLPWQKLRILPLNSEKQEELVGNTFLPMPEKEIVRQHIASSASTLHRNPLFLALLCRYVKEEKHAPANDHSLLERHITRLATRDVRHTRMRYDLSPEDLLQGAMRLAVLFAKETTLSLAPTVADIERALPISDVPGRNVERLLAALVDVKIGRSDVPQAIAGDRRFAFAHRRYQETLFVRYLAENPSQIPARELLTDVRWREYAVTLLQTQHAPILCPLLDEAVVLLDVYARQQEPIPVVAALGNKLDYYEWQGGAADYLLSLLQDGLSGRLADVPPRLSRSVELLLEPRWQAGDYFDRTKVIQLGAMLPQEKLVDRLAFAVTEGPNEMEECAFRSLVFLKDMPSELATWFRRRLSAKMFVAPGRVELRRLEALAARLPKTVGADFVVTRCRRLNQLIGGTSMFRFLGPLAKTMLAPEERRESTANELEEAAILFAGMVLAFSTGAYAIVFGWMAVLSPSRASQLLWGLAGLLTFVTLGTLSVRFFLRSAPHRIGVAFLANAIRPSNWSHQYQRSLVYFGCCTALESLLPIGALSGLAYLLFSWGLGLQTSFRFWFYGAFLLVMSVPTLAIVGIHHECWRARRRLQRVLHEVAHDSAIALHAVSMLELSEWLRCDDSRVLLNECIARSILRLLSLPREELTWEHRRFPYVWNRCRQLFAERRRPKRSSPSEPPVLDAISQRGWGSQTTVDLIIRLLLKGGIGRAFTQDAVEAPQTQKR